MSHAVKDIDRTPEYDQFMQQLRDFHESKGTPFQPEPVLGGQKLDLLKIYQTVIKAGGYKKVTENRGWKQVGDPFDFPPTCTNSAYILKLVYTKNLLGWEEEHYWKRPWNPPKEQFELKTIGTPSTASTPAASKPRDSARKTATAFTYQNAQPIPAFPQPLMAPPPAPIFHQPQVYVDESFPTRIMHSLTCTLPNEIDWAFNVLVRFSCTAENFSIDYMPTLIDSLMEFAEPFFKTHIQPILEHLEQVKEQDDESPAPVENLFSSKKIQQEYERVLQVFHVIRNFSFTDINIRSLAQNARLRDLLMMAISLPTDSQYAELSRHSLDIIESISPQIVLQSTDDDYLMAMHRLLVSPDRALVLGALRALTRVAVSESNESILAAVHYQDIIVRMSQFLLVDDEELVAATLEYLYQYSSLKGNFTVTLLKNYPGNLVGLLVGYLSYKSTLAPRTSALNSTIHSIPAAQFAKESKGQAQPPAIPDLTEYMNLDEPYRCLGWLREKLVAGTTEDKIEFKTIFGEYNELFGKQKPLAIKEFYTVLKIAFPQPDSVEEAVKTGSVPMNDLVLGKVKYAPPKEPEMIECHWADCTEKFKDEEGLHAHLVDVHLKTIEETANEGDKMDTSDDNHRAEGKTYECRWMACGRRGFKHKARVFQHLQTHFPGKVTKPTKRRNDKLSIEKIPVDDEDVSGVPLTAALLLRNLARTRELQSFLLPYKVELAQLAFQRPKLGAYAISVLEELHAAS
ncbi:at-rich interactive domain-containing protein 2 [Lichtheimia corymbifera JMRC:FSU:9682]|uniref:At-rich interactive domain-containing protein 2 n=1 Tax=Lichtheimia corymbifera JMRC:FSU:9682 TaxID=1263082 RepID=A0A068RW18_9FUNG|nr:at-rich interactive domain-containing protein 2 [Lichtheimia corymbifera JMRC:FSU:9682]